MKRQLLVLALVLASVMANAQILTFTDPVFKNVLTTKNCVDTNHDGTPDAKADLNADGNIDTAEALQVVDLYILAQYDVTSLQGIEHFANLEILYAEYHDIPVLDVSQLYKLKWLNVSSDHINTLILGTISNLENLDYAFNNISSLDLSHLSKLKKLSCSGNPLMTLDLSANPLLEELNCTNNQLSALNVAGLANLKILRCADNNLTALDISGLVNLEDIYCSSTNITSLNLTGLTKLHTLTCEDSMLTSLDISSLNALKFVRCNFNNIGTLITGQNPVLEELSIAFGTLTELNVNHLTSLKRIGCNGHQLTSLDVSNLVNLTSLQFSGNQVTSIDIRNCPNLDFMVCNNNNLQSMFVKNGGVFEPNNTYALGFDGNPNLAYICADENEFAAIQAKLNSYGYTSTVLNSYCSFTPGGAFYTINGSAKIDADTNGCDAADPLFPAVRMKIAGTASTGYMIGDDSGNHLINVQAGQHTVTPQLENPAYFNVTPQSVVVNFPSAGNPFAQNFCITPNGTHNDIEVFVEPVTRARPGFNYTCKVIYKNKGNTVLDGSVAVTYEDEYMELLSALPLYTGQAGNVNWEFAGLAPYESREIILNYVLNTPVDEDFPLNNGHVLPVTAQVATAVTDNTPADNIFTLQQQVVNSFDPNDKTCLEGMYITPDKVGGYVHYLIRFENKGTAEAVNIVVKDVINTAKFDINTLVPLSGSHNYVTRIKDVNTAEFIFEEINLPFDDANNDGYVLFKIKTKPSLALDDDFSNTASIFFDFNAPIVTNTYTTTVSNTLGMARPELTESVSVYPNPVNDVLYLQSSNDIDKIELYDLNGRLLQTGQGNVKNMSLRSLPQNVYLLKIYSGSVVEVKKVIKA